MVLTDIALLKIICSSQCHILALKKNPSANPGYELFNFREFFQIILKLKKITLFQFFVLKISMDRKEMGASAQPIMPPATPEIVIYTHSMSLYQAKICSFIDIVPVFRS